MDSVIQNLVNALQWGGFYSLIALGYCLVYGVIRLINFAHGDVFMVGAYAAFFAATWALGGLGLTGSGLGGLAALALTPPLAVAAAAGVGVGLERLAYRPLRRKGADRLYVVITALMAGLVLENGNLALLGAQRRSFPTLVSETGFTLFGASVTNLKLAVILTAVGSFLILDRVVMRSRIGRAMRAISVDPFALPLMGVNPDRVIVFTFLLGSGFAGLAGLLFAMTYPVLDPFMGALIGWKAFIAAVVGGVGSIRGAFAGGFILGFVEVGAAALFPSSYRDLIAFSILLAVLTIKPTGLFGLKTARKL